MSAIGKLLVALAFACVCMTTAPAAAQDGIVDQLRQRIITERRLADDREVQLLREKERARLDLQGRLERARGNSAAARREVASLTARLNDAARTERALVQEILQRDPASQLLVADLESELSQLAISATPQVKAALAEFGTGNRMAAWPRILAIANRGGPREKRIAARLRTIMFSYQDPGVSAQEVRDSWFAASSADPTNLLALTALAGAQQYLGNSQEALDTLAKAATVSRTAAERHMIAALRTGAAYALQKPDVMVQLLSEQLAAVRQLGNTGMPTANRLWLEAQTQVALAGFLSNVGRNADAAATYTEAARVIVEIQRLAPAWRFVDDALASTSLLKGNVESQLNRPDDALASYAVAITLLEKRIAEQPVDSVVASQGLAQAYINSCNNKQQRNMLTDALTLCARALEIQMTHPQSAARDYMLAGNATFVARLMLAAGKREDAISMFRYAVDMWGGLVRLDPVPALLFGHADALNGLAAVDETVCWRGVAAAWKALQDLVPLNDFQRRAFLHARISARAGVGCDLTPPPKR